MEKNAEIRRHLGVNKCVKYGIAHFTFDASGSVNKFDQQTIQECREATAAINANDDVKGVLFKSAKSVFIVGADITEFLGSFQAPECGCTARCR